MGDFLFYVEEVSYDGKKKFSREHLSNYQTMIRFPRSFHSELYPASFDITDTITIPTNKKLMISFNAFNLQERSRFTYLSRKQQCVDFVEMYLLVNSSKSEPLWRKCGTEFIKAEVYDYPVSLRFKSNFRWEHHGFSLQYSILSPEHSPLKIREGLFNCSVSYEWYKLHLDCNAVVECIGAEDERTGCGYHLVSGHACQAGEISAQVLWTKDNFFI